nr:deleted in malignant brain tumors 1 protein-like [Pocillopora verrucosa]
MNFEKFYRILIFLGLIEFFLQLSIGELNEEREASILGMMLEKHIFRKITGAVFGDVCLRDCYRDVRCQSFNYVFTQDMCELSNRTKEARPEDFIPNSERYYFRRDKNRVSLGSIPDLPAKSCREINKSEEGTAVSGKYWLDFSILEIPVLAYCHMETEVRVQSFVTVSSSCANSSTVLSGSSGILYSNKAQHYSNHMNCSWSLLSDNNIMLTFFKFDTEWRYDFVNVYDGRSTSSPLIGRYHGTSLPPVVTSSSNQLFITFTSDVSVRKPGFRASYRVVNEIRLIGNTSLTGSVEVFADGQWGTICEDGWDINDAHVICRQLGFPSAIKAFSSATHGQGSGQIWIHSLECTGNESHIYECSHNDYNCDHSGDASVECSSIIP